MDVKKQYIKPARRDQRPGLAITPKSITIHSTGNPKSTAQNEADYVCFNSKRKASFHYVVDEKEIIQVIPCYEMAYHAGPDANGQSIGIEICESGDRRKTLQNAADLVRMLKKNYKITEVTTHCNWTGKRCPRILIDKPFIKDGLDWVQFLRMVNTEPTPAKPKESGGNKLMYNKMEEIPAWAVGSVKWAMEKGILKGDTNGLALSHDNLKTIIFLHRYSQIDK